MSYEKALLVLGLPRNFTEEQLKTSYRKLCKANHPDINGVETEEKQKEINEAYDILKKRKKEPTQQTYSYEYETFNVDAYRQEKMLDLGDKVKFPNYENIIENERIKNIIFDLEEYQVLYIVTMGREKTKEGIDKVYRELINKIESDFKKIATLFLKEYDIPLEIAREKINFNTNLKELYKQLLFLKDKYSKVEQLKTRIDQEIAKYESFDCFKQIKKKINDYKETIISSIREKNYENIEEQIEKMHLYILEDIIKQYELISNKINYYEEIIKNIKDDNILETYKTIKQSWLTTNDVEETNKLLNNLENQIIKYQETEKFMSDINPIYQSIIARYSQKIAEKNILGEYREIKSLNERLSIVLELFNKCCKERKSKEFFNIFNEISFEENSKDEKIIQYLQFQTRKIYVKKKNSFNCAAIDRHSFFWIEQSEENPEELYVFLVNSKNVETYTISKEEFENEYVALEDILTPRTIEGVYKRHRYLNEIVFVLAECDDFVLYQYRDDYIIVLDSYVDLFDNCGKEKIDREDIIEAISKYIISRIQNDNKKRKHN